MVVVGVASQPETMRAAHPHAAPPLRKRRRRPAMPPSIIDEIQALMAPPPPPAPEPTSSPPARAAAETATMKNFLNFSLAYVKRAAAGLPDAPAAQERLSSLLRGLYPRWLTRALSTADAVAAVQQCVRSAAPAAANVDLAARFHAWARQTAAENSAAAAGRPPKRPPPPKPTANTTTQEQLHVTQFCKIALALLNLASKGRPEAPALEVSLRGRIAALSADWGAGRRTKDELLEEVAAAVRRIAPGERKPDVFEEFAKWTGLHARAPPAPAAVSMSMPAPAPVPAPAVSAPVQVLPPPAPTKRPDSATRERAALVGKFCRFAQQRHAQFASRLPAGESAQENFKSVIRRLWTSWASGAISQTDLLRTAASFVRASCPAAAGVDVVREFNDLMARDALRRKQAREAPAADARPGPRRDPAAGMAAIPAAEIGLATAVPLEDAKLNAFALDGVMPAGSVAMDARAKMERTIVGFEDKAGTFKEVGEDAVNVQYGCIDGNWE